VPLDGRPELETVYLLQVRYYYYYLYIDLSSLLHQEQQTEGGRQYETEIKHTMSSSPCKYYEILTIVVYFRDNNVSM